MLQDVRRLYRLMKWIKKVLGVATGRVDDELRDYFTTAWKEVGVVLDEAATQIDGITSEANSRWRELVAHGLTGAQLRMKLATIGRLVSNGDWDDLLDYLNSLLDSLNLKVVSEYKHAVLSVTRRSADQTPIPVLDAESDGAE